MQRPASMKTTKPNISGMTCGACVTHVTRALTAMPGVDHVEVSLGANTADVKFDEDRVSTGMLRAALQTAGYDVAAAPMQRASGCCGS